MTIFRKILAGPVRVLAIALGILSIVLLSVSELICPEWK